MKPCTLTFTFLLIVLPLFLIAQEKQFSGLDTKISVQIESGQLLDLFNEISSQSGIYFSYDPRLVNSEEPISLIVKNQTIQSILDEVFNDQFQFKLLKNQLIITNYKTTSDNTTKNLTIPETTRKISGKIIDQETNERVPYASISILGKTLGTISNIDGEFTLKVPIQYQSDTIVVSCMGYAQKELLLDTLKQEELLINLSPIKIQLREVQVIAANPLLIMDSLIYNISKNYQTTTTLMTSFYREVLKQDKKYVNVSEAIMNILKAPYSGSFREDQIRFLKGRKSKEVQPFQFVDFKMQGGPYYITKLDVIKTMDSFIDEEYRDYYHYQLEQTIDYLGHPTYIIQFQPEGKFDYISYEGKLFIDRKTFALVHAEFSLSRSGKKIARKLLIRKKPKDFNVRPLDLNYQITYKKYNGKWTLSSAQSSVKFRVKSKHDKINSIFHSISDLLVTAYSETNQKRFKRNEHFDSSDIFSDVITDYDEDFWGDYNVIEPSKDLREALKKETQIKSFIDNKSKTTNLTSQYKKK